MIVKLRHSIQLRSHNFERLLAQLLPLSGVTPHHTYRSLERFVHSIAST